MFRLILHSSSIRYVYFIHNRGVVSKQKEASKFLPDTSRTFKMKVQLSYCLYVYTLVKINGDIDVRSLLFEVFLLYFFVRMGLLLSPESRIYQHARIHSSYERSFKNKII
jgi:hypothetical protein